MGSVVDFMVMGICTVLGICIVIVLGICILMFGLAATPFKVGRVFGVNVFDMLTVDRIGFVDLIAADVVRETGSTIVPTPLPSGAAFGLKKIEEYEAFV